MVSSCHTTARSGNSSAACGYAAITGVPDFGLPNRKSRVGRNGYTMGAAALAVGGPGAKQLAPVRSALFTPLVGSSPA